MIAFLLLKYLASVSSVDWTVGALMAVIPVLLFIKRDIWLWLNKLNPDTSGKNEITGLTELDLW